MNKETFIQVPTEIAIKARRLYEVGLYEQALELLNRNKIMFEIYPTHVKVEFPKAKQRRYNFRRGK